MQNENITNLGFVNVKLTQGFKVLSRQAFSGFHDNGYIFRTALGFTDIKDYTYFQKDHHLPDVYFNHYKAVDDRYVIEDAVKQLGKYDKSFAYVLTINTHLPFALDAISEKKDEYKKLKKELGGLFKTKKSFDQFFLILEQLKFISEVISMNSIDRIVVVGDHPPPFLKTYERDLYSKKYVPALFANLAK